MDFPTCVGMARNSDLMAVYLGGFPHLRGDGPPLGDLTRRREQISPPAWGWPEVIRYATERVKDFPTCVGMARCRPASPASFDLKGSGIKF